MGFHVHKGTLSTCCDRIPCLSAGPGRWGSPPPASVPQIAISSFCKPRICIYRCERREGGWVWRENWASNCTWVTPRTGDLQPRQGLPTLPSFEANGRALMSLRLGIIPIVVYAPRHTMSRMHATSERLQRARMRDMEGVGRGGSR